VLDDEDDLPSQYYASETGNEPLEGEELEDVA
jgi:hypothetical protein